MQIVSKPIQSVGSFDGILSVLKEEVNHLFVVSIDRDKYEPHSPSPRSY